MENQAPQSLHEFPKDFKILHIGNIANNAFMASKLLRERGIQSDVIVYDMYHINSCPEWEQADMSGNYDNQFFPSWHKVNLRGYQRPKWIAQGPKYLCMRYLLAYRRNQKFKTWFFGRALKFFRYLMGKPARRDRFLKFYNSPPGRRLRQRFNFDVVPPKPINSSERFSGEAAVKLPLHSERAWSKMVSNPLYSRGRTRPFVRQETNAEGEEVFKKSKQPEYEDTIFFDTDGHYWEELFAEYDLVVGYSLDGIWPMASRKPYMALEHGTLRNIPFIGDITGFLTRACYENADATLITNCDGNVHADRMALDNYYYVPHPTQEDHYDQFEEAAQLRQVIEERRDANFIIFAPARQHWRPVRDDSWDKGNDRLIIGFAKFLKEDNPKGLLVMVDAGQTVKESKALIGELGITNNVLWIPPQPHRSFIRYMMASDLVCDQFNNGSFGGIPPKGMMCKKAVMTNIDKGMHDWCFPELPPFLFAEMPEEIYANIKKVYDDPAYKDQVAQAGYDWYYKYYSNEVFFQSFQKAAQSFFDLENKKYKLTKTPFKTNVRKPHVD